MAGMPCGLAIAGFTLGRVVVVRVVLGPCVAREGKARACDREREQARSRVSARAL